MNALQWDQRETVSSAFNLFPQEKQRAAGAHGTRGVWEQHLGFRPSAFPSQGQLPDHQTTSLALGTHRLLQGL